MGLEHSMKFRIEAIDDKDRHILVAGEMVEEDESSGNSGQSKMSLSLCPELSPP